MIRRTCSTTTAVEALLDATAHSRLEVAWRLLATAGLRVGEVLALRWADIDAIRGLITVRQAVADVPYAVLATPGCLAGERVVDALPVLDVLDRHHRRQEAARSEWGADYRDGGLVVCREDGRPLHPRDLHRALEGAAVEAGLPVIQLSDLRRGRRRGRSAVEIQS